MEQTPKQMLAPALPNILVNIIQKNCSDASFLTLSQLTRKVIEHTEEQLGYKPKNFDPKALQRRVRYSLQTSIDIDPKIYFKHHQTQRKTPLIKIYYAQRY